MENSSRIALSGPLIRADIAAALIAVYSGAPKTLIEFVPECVGIVGNKQVSIGGRARWNYESRPVYVPKWEDLHGSKIT